MADISDSIADGLRTSAGMKTAALGLMQRGLERVNETMIIIHLKVA